MKKKAQPKKNDKAMCPSYTLKGPCMKNKGHKGYHESLSGYVWSRGLGER